VIDAKNVIVLSQEPIHAGIDAICPLSILIDTVHKSPPVTLALPAFPLAIRPQDPCNCTDGNLIVKERRISGCRVVELRAKFCIGADPDENVP